MTKIASEKVLVLDFGSQFAQLIARRIRQQQVYCEIVRHDISAERVRELAPKGLILSGGPSSVYETGAPKCDPELIQLGLPVLGICYGLQTLNVHRAGSLVQHIESQTNHEAGRRVPIAHDVVIDEGSVLAGIVNDGNGNGSKIPVNSSHHQSAEKLGDGLRISARCPDDGVIEAIEGIDPNHFVLAVQWHPEESLEDLRLFSAIVEAARLYASGRGRR